VINPSAPVGDRMPTYFVAHGGGPWPWLMDELAFDLEPLARSLRAMPEQIGATPSAILLVSPHWETSVPTVQTNPLPPMLYDYWGFPDFTFEIQYPAPGSPEVAARVIELLTGADFTVAEDRERGFDHGAFVPLAVAFPDADIPVLQLSILSSYDPADHLAIGRALAPLRDEGVLIVGSGMSFHNMGLIGPGAANPSRQFDEWLTGVVTTTDGEARSDALLRWEQAPSARVAHPVEDHFVPLHVAVGAAEHDRGSRIFHQSDLYGGVHTSSFRFG
jgi:aromatic ring-opening dioxygenase catalytic subunit (LigB family)